MRSAKPFCAVVRAAALLAFVLVAQTQYAFAAADAWVPVPCAAVGLDGEAPEPDRGFVVKAGRETERVWITAERGELRIAKFTAKTGASVLELAHRNDRVVLQMSEGLIRLFRGKESVVIDSPSAFERVQNVLAGSSAIFQARRVFSELESRSALRAPDMSVLLSLALVNGLTGDINAVQRLSDRFRFVHRGIIRQVRFDDGASCWTTYEQEVNSSYNDWEACVKEAVEAGGIFVDWRMNACTIRHFLRGESAWFEYLKCLSPLAAIAREP